MDSIQIWAQYNKWLQYKKGFNIRNEFNINWVQYNK